jgi:predicted peptidase
MTGPVVRRLALALGVGALASPAHASTRVEAGALDTTLSRRAHLPYRVYLPAGYDPKGKPWPTILFLHGSGERGTDLSFVERNGPPKIALSRGLPFIVVAPQLQVGVTWSTDALLALLDRVESEYRVDTTRVALTGLSMGGYGAYELAIAAPSRFASLLVVSGAGNPVEICRLRALPVWIVHGAKDDVIPPEWGAGMAHRLERCPGNVRLSIDPDAGHDAWTRVYDDPKTYEWMLAQRTAAP